MLKVKILLVLFTLVGSLLEAQNLRRADTYFEDGAYDKAIEEYEAALKKEHDFRARLRLARSYRMVGELEKSVENYTQVVTDSASLPVHKFELGKVLKSLGRYGHAKAWFETYAMESADADLGRKWAASCELALELQKDSLGYKIISQPLINTRFSEISPVNFRAGVAFSSNRKRGFFFRFFNGYRRGAFYDLYYAQRGPDGRLRRPEYLRQLNSRYHDGPVSFSASENLAFVTRSNTGAVGGRRDAAGFNRVSVYMLRQRLDNWVDAEPLPFSSKEFNIAHPAISKDGETLYFTSDMPGGYGGTDIWKSTYEDGKWTRPVNLGAQVNTEANEGYPFMVHDSLLYFSSERAEGFGGKDIFYARKKDGKWGYVKNAGYPLNSEADDFAYSITDDSPYGYFVSNREGGKGDDDVFGFRRYRALEGQVVNNRTGEPLQGATVQIQDLAGKAHFYATDEQGLFRHYVQVGDLVKLEADLDDFRAHKARISLEEVGPDEDKFVLIPLEEIKRLMLLGNIKEAESGAPVEDVAVHVMGYRKEMHATDAEGKFEQELQAEQDYTVIMVKEGYMPEIVDLSTVGETDPKKFIIDADLRKGPFVLLEGMVNDADKGLVIPGANIHIVEANTQQELQAFKARQDGQFWRALNTEESFSIIATFENYLTARVDILRDSTQSDTVRANLKLIPLEVGEVVKVVYYDYDRSNIRILGMRDLNEIAYFLLDNPEISVVLESHTDARGSRGYNQRLSQRRAQSAVDYLIGRGVAANRISAEGFGESKLANDCGDGRDCSEALHQANRRTDVRVVRVDEEIRQEKDTRNRVEEEKGEEVEEKSYDKGVIEYQEKIRPR